MAQVFAAHYPRRIRTLTLTNCDVHDNFPPEAFRPFVDLAESGEFGPMVAAMAADLALARSDVGFGMGYAHPEQLSDAILASYLAPFIADQGKGLERLLTASSAADLMAVAPLLAELHAPTMVAWGTGDSFFAAEWADRLESMIPGVERGRARPWAPCCSGPMSGPPTSFLCYTTSGPHTPDDAVRHCAGVSGHRADRASACRVALRPGGRGGTAGRS